MTINGTVVSLSPSETDIVVGGTTSLLGAGTATGGSGRARQRDQRIVLRARRGRGGRGRRGGPGGLRGSLAALVFGC